MTSYEFHMKRYIDEDNPYGMKVFYMKFVNYAKDRMFVRYIIDVAGLRGASQGTEIRGAIVKWLEANYDDIDMHYSVATI